MSKIQAKNRIGYQIDSLAYGPDEDTSTTPYRSNAPVTRVLWTCSNLPEGVTLSASGLLEGHPTTAGTYSCNVELETNWGITTKTITITVK